MNTTNDQMLAREALNLIDATLAATRYVAAVRVRAALVATPDLVATELAALRVEVSEHLATEAAISDLKPVVDLLRPVARGRCRDAMLARAATAVADAWEACKLPASIELDWVGTALPLAALAMARSFP
jgi:hypothetical protein